MIVQVESPVAKKTSGQLMKREGAGISRARSLEGKATVVCQFLHQCHDVTQYFVDLFCNAVTTLVSLLTQPTVHLGRERFGITTRLGQALAKQALIMYPV